MFSVTYLLELHNDIYLFVIVGIIFKSIDVNVLKFSTFIVKKTIQIFKNMYIVNVYQQFIV
jgi:hypothetical protein